MTKPQKISMIRMSQDDIEFILHVLGTIPIDQDKYNEKHADNFVVLCCMVNGWRAQIEEEYGE